MQKLNNHGAIDLKSDYTFIYDKDDIQATIASKILEIIMPFLKHRETINYPDEEKAVDDILDKVKWELLPWKNFAR